MFQGFVGMFFECGINWIYPLSSQWHMKSYVGIPYVILRLELLATGILGEGVDLKY